MFTGLIQARGIIVDRQRAGDGMTLGVDGGDEFLADMTAKKNHGDKNNGKNLGASIAVNGVCLTIAEWRDRAMVFHLSRETLTRTTAGDWAGDGASAGVKGQQKNQLVNLEYSLKMGDELGGHFVFGHVDGVGQVARLEKPTAPGNDWQLGVRLPSAMASMMAEKGSVAIDGCSLTINRVKDDIIDMTIIPHTIAHTIAEFYSLGQKVNIEIDMLMRYVMRAMNSTKDKNETR